MAFKEDKKWSDILNDQTNLVTFLKSDHLKDEKKPDEISVSSLMLLGLLLCAGDVPLKARVFYDIL